MTEITRVRLLAVLTVFGKEYYSNEGESDMDELNIQESDKPRSDDRQTLRAQFPGEGRHLTSVRSVQ